MVVIVISLSLMTGKVSLFFLCCYLCPESVNPEVVATLAYAELTTGHWDNWQELIQRIKSLGMRPGVALKPGTPIGDVYPLVEAEAPVEMVLVMTVEPGFGGQKFMPEMMDKVRILRKKYPSLDIEVDGGLGPSTIEMAASAGANCIVAGSSVFGAPEPAEVISLLRNSVQKAQQKC
ncbi:hypothetical protein AHAS_Ahas10G0169600 [Arachis hypogaea]